MCAGYLSICFENLPNIFLILESICSHLSSPLFQTTGVSPLVHQLPHGGCGSLLAKCEIVSFSIKAWQEDCLESSKRKHIFKPGMQFVLSARRTLTGLPDIGSYKVSQPPTTSTIQPSTLWSQQVSTSLSTMITIQRLPYPQQVSTRKNVCQHRICWLWLSSYNCLSHDCMVHIRHENCQTKSFLDFGAIHFTH